MQCDVITGFRPPQLDRGPREIQEALEHTGFPKYLKEKGQELKISEWLDFFPVKKKFRKGEGGATLVAFIAYI